LNYLAKFGESNNLVDSAIYDTSGELFVSGTLHITGSFNVSGSGSLNGDNIVASNTIKKIETISSASYASLTPPVSGTLYIII
jgi:hypothetical protein